MSTGQLILFLVILVVGFIPPLVYVCVKLGTFAYLMARKQFDKGERNGSEPQAD